MPISLLHRSSSAATSSGNTAPCFSAYAHSASNAPVLISTVVLIPFSDLGMMADYASRGPADLGYLVLHAAVASFLPYILYTTAMSRMEGGTASILAAAGEPTAAAVFGLLFFTEIPTPLMLVGMVIAIGSMAVMCMPSGSNRSPAAQN